MKFLVYIKKAKDYEWEFEPTVCSYCGKKEPCRCKEKN